MCVVGVFARRPSRPSTMEDKMLLKGVLSNTGWTSADAERIGLLQNRPAMCRSAFTGALRHHHLDHLVHLVVLLAQADFGDATSMEELLRGDWWIFSPLCFFQLHCQLALGLFSFLTACCA